VRNRWRNVPLSLRGRLRTGADDEDIKGQAENIQHAAAQRSDALSNSFSFAFGMRKRREGNANWAHLEKHVFATATIFCCFFLEEIKFLTVYQRIKQNSDY